MKIQNFIIMKRVYYIFVIAAIMMACTQQPADQAQDADDAQSQVMQASEDAVPLFNGENLDGWVKRGGNAEYRIENGEIVGVTVMNTPNTFLCTEQDYGDFILDLDLKVSDFNSGVQFRSLSSPDYRDGRVHGYQCEVDPSDRAWSGGVYDEARRGWLYPLTVNEKGRKAFKIGEWNHYHIEAIGNTIRTWVNGIPVAHLIDDMTAEGFIALQVHGIGDHQEAEGKEVRWKNIMIQTENLQPAPSTDIFVINKVPNTLSEQEKEQGWELLFDGTSTDMWRNAHADSFPSFGWRVENGELIVSESGGGEAEHGGDIITKKEFKTFEFQLEFKLTEGANSGIKYFITENYGPSRGSAIGLEFQLLDDERHPDATKGVGANRTLASLYDLIPSNQSNRFKYTPGEWGHARLVVKGVREEYRVQDGNSADISFPGANVEHWLNHSKALTYCRGTQMFQALIQKSKYADFEDFGMWEQGHILLQDHGNRVHFRSIKVREL